MKDLLTWIIATVIGFAILAGAIGFANDAAARKTYAAAAMVREQSQARQDLLAAMLPYAAMTIVVVVLLVIAGLTIYAIANRPPAIRPQIINPPPTTTRIIERQIIMVLQPDQTRREFWRQLSQAADIKLIGGRRDEIL